MKSHNVRKGPTNTWRVLVNEKTVYRWFFFLLLPLQIVSIFSLNFIVIDLGLPMENFMPSSLFLMLNWFISHVLIKYFFILYFSNQTWCTPNVAYAVIPLTLEIVKYYGVFKCFPRMVLKRFPWSFPWNKQFQSGICNSQISS